MSGRVIVVGLGAGVGAAWRLASARDHRADRAPLLFSGPCLVPNGLVPHPQKGCPAGPSPVGARVA